MARAKKYPDGLVRRGVRLALEGERPIAHIAHDLGMHPETLRERVRQAGVDSGERPELLSSGERGDLVGAAQLIVLLAQPPDLLKSASLFLPASSTQTVRSEPLHR